MRCLSLIGIGVSWTSGCTGSINKNTKDQKHHFPQEKEKGMVERSEISFIEVYQLYQLGSTSKFFTALRLDRKCENNPSFLLTEKQTNAYSIVHLK